MAQYMYERLSAQDNSFLVAEEENVPLHIAAVGILELGDLATPDGGVDIRKFKRATEAQLHRIPRYRQRLAYVPFENRPVWIDDQHFNIDYHIRHTALPRPGGVEELKKLVARILTRQLDRARPLWEIWVVEGLQDDRFAMVSKIHHCMVDGSSGADVAQILLSPTPEHQVEEPPPYYPRPAPTRAELVRDAVERQLSLPFRLLRGLRNFGEETADLRAEIGTRAKALTDLVGSIIMPSSETPINGPLSPHRRIDWLTLPLDDVRGVRRSLGCTGNDIVLATVSGAIRHYLMRHGVDPAEIDFRVSAPVDVRRDEDKGKMGNRVSSWIVRLPIDEERPLGWVERISEETRKLKESRQALGIDMMMKAAEYFPPSILAWGAKAASGPINMIVTNVPGPQFPLYILGARLLEMHPIVPLLDGTGLGIALFSYDGKLGIGLNADYERVPDVGTLTALLAQSFMALKDAVERQVVAKEHPAGESAQDEAGEASEQGDERERVPLRLAGNDEGDTAIAGG